MNKDKISDFKNALDNICGEANEAAKIANELFSPEDQKQIRRSLAKIMEIVESDITPGYHKIATSEE